jgi:hypothetical protein
LCPHKWMVRDGHRILDGVSLSDDLAAGERIFEHKLATAAAAAAAAPAAAAASAPAPPVESFLGERLLHWVYSDHEEYSYVQLEEAMVCERSEADIAGLASKSDLLQGLLSTKLSVRRQVDNILTAAATQSLVRRAAPPPQVDRDWFQRLKQTCGGNGFRL